MKTWLVVVICNDYNFYSHVVRHKFQIFEIISQSSYITKADIGIIILHSIRYDLNN